MAQPNEGSSDREGGCSVWWIVQSIEDGKEAESPVFAYSADSRSIRITRADGPTDGDSFVKDLRKKGASERLIENLTWTLPLFGEDGRQTGAGMHIKSIAIFSCGETILPTA